MVKKPSRRGSSAPTIADVAKRAGVSPMTVSRVINGEQTVRPLTRAAVEEAIRQLNYAPNSAARSLAGGGQVRIGLLYSNPSAAYLSEFLVGVLDQAARGDVQLVIEKCEPGQDEQRAARHLIDGGVDGVLLPPPLSDAADVIALFGEAGVSVVVVASARPPDRVSSVGIDDFEAARAMTNHLLAMGHDRIGFIIGNPNQHASARRLEGYRAALGERGNRIDEGLIAQGLFTYRSGLDAAELLLANASPPTAIFASNDDMAAAAVAVAHRRGVDVPGDLSVCGFDDTPFATTIWPALTTIHQPIAEMSRAALDQLVGEVRERRAGKAAPFRRVLLDFALVRRHSDAPPRRRRPELASGKR
ncbi:LacI family DNA-binding transcriptional regulator [Hephaestia sp. GCM10023244]|uniref:LacI family DNA-binding transcriptional regulator n=1 Tax=unclassified Hephaestia TaxID=2631281 RepID=UPI0020779BAA|nr:LacI family DNA-binding transcriptional regulator [Hephaestia sp. MAHUQ-44]MCM8730623.1 LacI family DNA-binding transcriptional regulator [Hephaestia sp. MAHUQ-44]